MYAPFVPHHLAGSPRKVLGPRPRPFEYVGAGAGAGGEREQRIPLLKWSRCLLFGVPGRVFLRFCSMLFCNVCLALWCMCLVDDSWQRQERRQIEALPPDSPEPEPQTPPPRAPPPPFPDVSPPRRRTRRGSNFGVRRRTGRIQHIPI